MGDLENRVRAARLLPLVRRRAGIHQPEPGPALTERLMAVPEADHVHALLREGAHAPIDGGPARPVAVHEAEADPVHRHDLASAEARHELWRVVVAGHRLERRESLEELGNTGAREISEVHDELHAFVAEAVAKRSRKLGAEARHMGVGHHADFHALTVARRLRASGRHELRRSEPGWGPEMLGQPGRRRAVMIEQEDTEPLGEQCRSVYVSTRGGSVTGHLD